VEPLAVLALLGVAAGGLAQSVTGLGFALVAAPGLIALLGPTEGVAVVVGLGILASVIPLLGQWRRVRVRDAGTLLVPTLVATPVVGALVADVETRALAIAAGFAVLVGVAALWRGLRSARLVSIPGAIAAGTTSAVMNVIGGVGGPPIALYAANAGWDPPDARATLQGIFLVQGIVTMLVIGPVLPNWWQLAAMAAGALAGRWLAPRIPEPAARAAVLAVAGFGGVALVLGNL
jgi:uncharacterized membrane protein YfcA